jgi:excisionase family DNA binding protein
VRATRPPASDDLTVSEAAEALGTSPQTVRRLLRDGELRGRKEPWGNRFVWVPSRTGVEEFLSEHGPLNGRRRLRASPEAVPDPAPVPPSAGRPRERALVMLAVVGPPLVFMFAAAKILPAALWFHELGQLGVFRRVATAEVDIWLGVATVSAIVIGTNLSVALRRTGVAGGRGTTLAVAAVSLIGATFFTSAATRHWETFLLWLHRRPFGVADPLFGKDVGYFVFSLPFERLVSALLLGLIATAAAASLVVYRTRDALTLRPPRASHQAQVHLAALAAAFLLVVAWRLHLARYGLELGQPAAADSGTFAGAGYVDVHVRSPGLATLSALAVVSAFACVAAAQLAQAGFPRRAKWTIAIPAGSFLVVAISVGSWLPALVERFAVHPSPLLSEQPYVQRAIDATRSGLGLDRIDARAYAPKGRLTAADVSDARSRLSRAVVWDRRVIEARMHDLVSDAPYYRPERPTFDVTRVGRHRQTTLASARELDLGAIGGQGQSWASDRLTYTHGVGLPRFSETAIERGGQPRLLDAGLHLRQPRIYFGNLLSGSPGWVLVDSRRPEADLPSAQGEYHYDGSAGIGLSGWIRRAAFALELGSKDLLISRDVTPGTRILLHRDVRDRLSTLAPFIHWDAHPVPLAVGGRIVFVDQGYTTSASYPGAERVTLGGASVNYARASVLATVDAFSGQVRLYRTDPSDPVASAWADAFPSLFRRPEEIPAGLRGRLRYPADLFRAQSTAYERFHATRPDVFASGSDLWSPPTSLSGSIEVAGDIKFDQSDEDDLRHAMRPEYKFAPPPGRTGPRVLLSTFYSPSRGQNLIASLEGWVDARGRPRLGARLLPRDPIRLGPAQVSRLVFSTPRVSALLGLTNLELRDLDRSSLDAVSLGSPRLLFLPHGIIQLQTLYKGASGAGVSRIIGVTAFLNGRAGVGSNVADAVRHALHEPPSVEVLRPHTRPVVGTPVALHFRARNVRRATVTIVSPASRDHAYRASFAGGPHTVTWVPPAAGGARIRIAVVGLDGSTATDHRTVRVLGPAPAIRITHRPARVAVGRPAQIAFEVEHASSETARISARDGTLTRRYVIHRGRGVLPWTPTATGRAVIRIRALGGQGQAADATATVSVAPPPRVAAPVVKLVRFPERATVGRRSEIAVEATGSREVVARITADGRAPQTWRFARPAAPVVFGWTPARAGRYRLTVTARARDGTTTQTSTALTAERAR